MKSFVLLAVLLAVFAAGTVSMADIPPFDPNRHAGPPIEPVPPSAPKKDEKSKDNSKEKSKEKSQEKSQDKSKEQSKKNKTEEKKKS